MPETAGLSRPQRWGVVAGVVAVHAALWWAGVGQSSSVRPAGEMVATVELTAPPAAAPSPPPALPAPRVLPPPLARPLPVAVPAAQPVAQPVAALPVAAQTTAATAPARATSPAATSQVRASPALPDRAPDYQAAYLHNPRPVYPPMAVQMGWQGRVVLQVEVLRDGRAGQVSVARSSGHAVLDEAAMQAVRGWQFVPARRDGQLVDQTFLVPLPFVLKESDDD